METTLKYFSSLFYDFSPKKSNIFDDDECTTEELLKNISNNIKILKASVPVIDVNGNIAKEIKHLDEIEESLQKVSTKIIENECENIPFSGYRSIIKLYSRILIVANDSSEELKIKIIDSLYSMEKCYKMFSIHEKYCENEDKYFNEKYEIEMKVIVGVLNTFHENPSAWVTLNMSPLSMIHLKGNLKSIHQRCRRYMSLGCLNISYIEMFKAALCEKFAIEFLSNDISDFNIHKVKRVLDIGQGITEIASVFYNIKHSIFGSNTRVKDYDINIPMKYSIKLQKDGKLKYSKNENEEINIKFQVAQNFNENTFHKKVVIFLHGGAFIGPKASTMEYIYVRDFAESMPGVTVINFDYTKCPQGRFPQQVEELLNLYLWLKNGYLNDGKYKMFGFTDPSDVVIVGDSAGGHISLEFLVALNEMKNIFLEPLSLPKGVVLINSKIIMSTFISASYAFTFVDMPLVTPIAPVIMKAFIPIMKYDESKNEFELMSIEEQRQLDEKEMFNLSKYRLIYNHILDPLSYDKFNDINHIKLHIFSAEFDPVLDESILLAKKWKKEHLKVKIFKNMGHASQGFKAFDSYAKSGQNEIIKLIITAFE